MQTGVAEHDLLVTYPPPPELAAHAVLAATSGAHRLVVLDDDPTGTQTVADIPVVTQWSEEDIRWALRQGTPGFYVLTNTRSLNESAATRRNREVLRSVMAAAAEAQVKITLVSRSDSTLRGHFPAETDALTAGLREYGVNVDGTVLVPAFTDAGRITVDSTHWVRTPSGMVRASETEFARDPEFGYQASTLHDYVAEKTRGRWPSDQVMRITLDQLRSMQPASIAGELARLHAGRPAVVDAASDADLGVLALAGIEAERQGLNLLYRTGPSFVRSRLGQQQHPAMTTAEIQTVLDAAGRAPCDSSQEASPYGLVVVGSYVGLTTVQLELLRTIPGLTAFDLDVSAVLGSGADSASAESLVSAITTALATGDVVLATSRTRLDGADEDTSRSIQADVSSALVRIVAAAVARRRPRWLVAKGGITSSDLATRALNIRRAWVRGTLLPGIVSLWEPAEQTAQQIPYVVFAGNVGEADSLAAVVKRLRRSG